MSRMPATVVTGFLGAGKTTLLRHLLAHAGGRRIAVIVNEFGSLGIDGQTLRGCGVPECRDEDIVELSNGCLCCTVADDFIPTIEALLARDPPPEHLLIETSGLALPKPLLRAFGWPAIRARVTVDGVITVVDGPAVAAGRFADDPDAVAAQRAADPAIAGALDHDNPLAEVFEDQLASADLVVLNKADMMDEAALAAVEASITAALPRAVKLVRAVDGRLPATLALGLAAAAEDDLAARPSHHDALDGEHEHDDFASFVVPMRPVAEAGQVARLVEVATRFDVLRMKGFLAVRDKPMRLAVQGVGGRFRHEFDRAWRNGEVRDGALVVIGRAGLDQAAVKTAIEEVLF